GGGGLDRRTRVPARVRRPPAAPHDPAGGGRQALRPPAGGRPAARQPRAGVRGERRPRLRGDRRGEGLARSGRGGAAGAAPGYAPLRDESPLRLPRTSRRHAGPGAGPAAPAARRPRPRLRPLPGLRPAPPPPRARADLAVRLDRLARLPAAPRP